MEEAAAIEVKDLAVRYGSVQAIRSMSFAFQGMSLGILGPNGAGKSSLIKSLLGLISYEGHASVLGHSCRAERLELRRRVGYVPEKDCHIPDMTAVDYVTLGGELSGMPRIDAISRAHEMLYFCGLGEARYRKVDGYSAGMKQRIKLAHALVHDPELVFLDEPTNGLDPDGRISLLGILRDLQAHKQIRIVLCSHLLRDVESVCREVVVIREGAVVRHASIDALKSISERHWKIRVRGPLEDFQKSLLARGCTIESTGREDYLVETPPGGGAPMILESARSHGCQLRLLQRREVSLQDAFMKTIRDGESGSAGEASHAGL